MPEFAKAKICILDGDVNGVMDLIDATLSYISAPRDGLPKLAVFGQTFDRKAGNYRSWH